MTENVQNIASDESFNLSIENIFELLNTYEAHVKALQNEARQFREDKQDLRRKLEEVIAENERLTGQVNEDLVAEFRNNYIEVSDGIIENHRKQFVLCCQEKEMYENLYQKYKTMCEHEIPNSSIAKIKNEYDIEVSQLKVKLREFHEENRKKTEINEFLQSNIKQALTKIKSIQQENIELKEAKRELNEKIKALEAANEEITRVNEESRELLKLQIEKEEQTLEKLHQSIKFSEEMMKEYELAMDMKKSVEDEQDHLAQTIGTVMREAAEKYDNSTKELQLQHKNEMENSKIEIERLRQEVEHERLKTTSALQQVKMLEDKIRSSEMTNSYLGEDLEHAMKTIADTKEELQKLKIQISDERESRQLCEYELKKRREIIDNYKKEKKLWKDLILEMTRRVEGQIQNVANDLTRLPPQTL